MFGTVGPMAERAAVLGSPIAHSLSPTLHTAGYRALGLDDWEYTRADVAHDTGSINTLLHRPDGGWDADNTDVVGVLGALAEVGVEHAKRPAVVGFGATRSCHNRS